MRFTALLLSLLVMAMLQTSCNSNSQDTQKNKIVTSNSGNMMNASLQSPDNKNPEAEPQEDKSGVVINGITLDKSQIQDLKKIYGA